MGIQSVVMAFFAPLVPVAISASKINANAHAEKPDSTFSRQKSVVDRLCAGPGSPISHWSDQHLDRMIKTNSAFREFEQELRQCHAEKRITPMMKVDKKLSWSGKKHHVSIEFACPATGESGRI